MTVWVGWKGRIIPFKAPREPAQMGVGREQGARKHKLTENAERDDGKVEHEAKLFVTLHRERNQGPKTFVQPQDRRLLSWLGE